MSRLKSSNNLEQAIANNSDVIVNILSRLPLKSLLKCKCVCKWWQFLISDPIFIRNYSLRNPHHYVSGLFLQKYLPFHLYSDLEFIRLDGDAESAPQASLSFIDDNEGVHIEHSCNGLLCCSSLRSQETDRIYYICKPTTKQYVALPRPPTGLIVFAINVVFDPTKSLHYKVVCICDSELSENHRQINVYSSETGLWRPSGDTFFILDDFLFNWGDFNRSNNRGVYWNGALHWIGRGETSLRYDVEGESLLEMPILPVTSRRAKRMLAYFGESQDHLHLIQFYGHPTRTTLFDVLEMKSDYSGWFVKYRVDLDVVAMIIQFNVQPIHRFAFSILHLIRGGGGGGGRGRGRGHGHAEDEEESFLLLHIPGKFISYNLRDGTFAELRDLSPHLMNMDKDLGLQYSWEDVHQYTNTISYL